MNLKVFQCYQLPHPLRKGEEIIVSDEDRRAVLRNAAWEFCRESVPSRPKILRFLISARAPGGRPPPDEYFKKLKQKEDREFNRMKVEICMKFLSSLLIGYLLYLAPPAFWQPIETVFDTVAHGMSDYAKLWIILFFPVKGLIRNFGTGIQIPLPAFFSGSPVFRKIPLIGRMRKIGAAGRWQRLNSAAGSTALYPLLDKNLAEEFASDVDKCILNIEKKSKNSNDMARKLKEHTDELLCGYAAMDEDAVAAWNSEFLDFLARASESAGKGGGFPWGEIPKLDRLRRDLLFFGGGNKFIFAPVKEIYPETEDCLQAIDLNMEIRMVSALKQSRNLRAFLDDPETRRLSSRIYSCYEELNASGCSDEILPTLDSLSGAFADLRDLIGSFHMGMNFMIPNEKGKDLSDFYHRLYLIFGKASGDIMNGYKRTGWGIRPVLTGRAARQRVQEAVDQAFDLIENRKNRKAARIKDSIISFIGKRAACGLGVAALILFIFGSLISIYSLNPDETAVLNTFRLGYEDKFFNREVSTRSWGQGLSLPGIRRQLYWHLPPPLTRMQRISTRRTSEFTVHMVIGESHTNNPWKKFLQTMSGQLGMSFYIAELDFEYSPASAETWKDYDADGKGYKRLIRDTSSIVEEWKTDLISSYSDGITSLEDEKEVNYIFTTYFRELSEKGVIEDYIRRSFSQTALSTHVYYGSPIERYEPGFITVIDELERRSEEYGRDPFLNNNEKAELQDAMNRAKSIVESTLERVKTQVEVEYGDLRRHPDMLMKIVEDPYLHLQELRNFETLWSGIQSYTWHLYNQDKIKDVLSSGCRVVSDPPQGSDNKDYVLEMINRLNSDPHLNKLIRIKAVDYRVKDMGVSRLNLIQQKWKDII